MKTLLFRKKYINKHNMFNFNIQKNILFSVCIKGFSILISLLLVRITYDYINNDILYGIWITILSVLTWMNFFDIGLGNGLRNKLTESISDENYDYCQKYISTTYFIMGLIIFVLVIIFSFLSNYINWNKVFNSNIVTEKYLETTMLIIIISYLVKLFLSLLNSVFYALQKSYLPGLLNLLSNLVFLLVLIILRVLELSSFFLLGLSYSVSFLIVIILATVYFYNFKEKRFKPKLKKIKFRLIKPLFSLGFKFVFVQMFTIILFTTDSIVITQILGPESVIEYQITQKLFNVFTMVFNIIATPFWSAYTYQYKAGNIDWIISCIKKQIKILYVFIFFIILMVVFFNDILMLWMRSRVTVHTSLIVLMAIYSIVFIWYNIFSYVANGIGKLKFQTIIYIIGCLLNVPLSIFMAKNMKLGVDGVILATIICLLLYCIPEPILIRKRLNNQSDKYKIL